MRTLQSGRRAAQLRRWVDERPRREAGGKATVAWHGLTGELFPGFALVTDPNNKSYDRLRANDSGVRFVRAAWVPVRPPPLVVFG